MSRESIAKDVMTTYESSSELLKEEPKLAYCQQLVDECIANKAGLIALLSKHPNWDAENLRVHFDADYTRAVNKNVAISSLSSMGYTLRTYPGRSEYIERLGRMLMSEPEWFITPITEEVAANVKKLWFDNVDDVHIHAGSKPTKAVMKLLRQFGFDSLPEDVKHEALRSYSQYADNINPITIKRHTVISVNPVDFLRMSDGNSWTSCHRVANLNEEWGEDQEFGCYSAGTLSYAYDKQTMIMYTVDAEAEDITFYPKTTRQLYFWNGYVLLGSRVYPQSMDGDNYEYESHRVIAEKVIADCLGESNIWRRVEEYRTESYGLHYPDYEYAKYPAYELSFRTQDEFYTKTFEIGCANRYITCVVCGGHGDFESGNPVCINCLSRNRFYCELCGEYEYGESHWVNGEDFYVCDYHWDDRIRACTECGYDYDNEGDRLTWVDSVDEYVCDDCLANYYRWSEYSEEYYKTDDMVNLDGIGWVTEDEAEEYYAYAEDTERYHLIDDLHDYEDPETGELHYYYNNIPEVA